MICHKCGFLNPENTKICLACGTKLITNINPKFGDLSEFSNENFITQLVSRFEDNFSSIFNTLQSLENKTQTLEEQIMELRSGLFTLVDLLSEKELIKREKFSHVWENNILLNLALEEEKKKFLTVRDEILLIEENSKKEQLERVLNKVENLYSNGQTEKALEELEKASKKHKKNYKLNLFLGQIHYIKKHYSKAIEYLFKSYALNSNDYETNLHLGIVLNEVGKQEESKNFLLKAIEINSEDYLPFFTLGTIYYFEEDYKIAEFFLSQAINIEKTPETLFFLALVYREMNRRKKAEKLLKEVIELEPDFEDAYYYLGMIYLELNWNKKAKKMFEKVLSINPSRFELNAFKSGKHYDYLGIKLNDELNPFTRKCEKMVSEGDLGKAIKCYQTLLNSFPENPALIVKLSSLYIEYENAEKAIKLAKQLIKPETSENILLHVYNIMHTGYLMLGNVNEAISLMEAFLKQAKDDYSKSFVYITLSFDYIDIEELKKAEDYSKKGLKIAPRQLRHYALDSLGWINYKKKRYKKALELLLESITIEPNNQSAIYHLGMVYLAMKKKHEAKKLFSKLLKLKDEENPHINPIEIE